VLIPTGTAPDAMPGRGSPSSQDSKRVCRKFPAMAALFLAALLLRSPFSFTALRSSARAKVHGLTTMRLGPGAGSDPVNNVSPEMQSAGLKWAQKYEDVLLAGHKLWKTIKKNAKEPKKFYFIGQNGNSGAEIAEAVLDALSYIPAPDGTKFMHRKPGMNYPKMHYALQNTDTALSDRSEIPAVDLYMDNEEKYRELEYTIVKEFSEEDRGYPMGCVLGEGALLKEETQEIVKNGLVVWLDTDPEHSWAKTQFKSKQGGGLYVPNQAAGVRPPVWAIANGWDGDVDDTEGKVEYIKMVQERRELYEKAADIRLRTDIPGIVENTYWGASKICKAVTEYLGYKDAEEGSVEQEIMETDLEKFLEGARLSKYFKKASDWCEEQGAASIEDIVENVDDFAEAMALKPLEKKRLVKAAASVAIAS